MAALLMRREQRLRRRQDFKAVYRAGRPFVRQSLVLRVRPNPDTPVPRFGFTVGKRLGNAVLRNRVRRRLRAAARLSGARGSVDIVIIARASAATASYQDLERTLRALLDKAGLLADKREQP